MRRWAKNLLTILSLLVFVGSVTLWVRSYFAGDEISRLVEHSDAHAPRMHREILDQLGLHPGVIEFFHGTGFWTDATLSMQNVWRYACDPPSESEAYLEGGATDYFRVRLGPLLVHYKDNVYSIWKTDLTVILPFWLFLPAAIPPFLWWRRWGRGNARGFAVETTEPALPKMQDD